MTPREPWCPPPEEPALRLDAWLLAHREPTEPDPGRAPVSGRLPTASMIDEINDLLEALNDPRHNWATGAERRAWLERKVRVLEQLAELEPAYGHPHHHAAARKTADSLERVRSKLHGGDRRRGGKVGSRE